jgi:hypothetical protein
MLGESALILNASVKFLAQAFHQEATKSNPEIIQEEGQSAFSMRDFRCFAPRNTSLRNTDALRSSLTDLFSVLNATGMCTRARNGPV